MIAAAVVFVLLHWLPIPVHMLRLKKERSQTKYITLNDRLASAYYQLGIEAVNSSLWNATWYWLHGARLGNEDCKTALNSILPERLAAWICEPDKLLAASPLDYYIY